MRVYSTCLTSYCDVLLLHVYSPLSGLRFMTHCSEGCFAEALLLEAPSFGTCLQSYATPFGKLWCLHRRTGRWNRRSKNFGGLVSVSFNLHFISFGIDKKQKVYCQRTSQVGRCNPRHHRRRFYFARAHIRCDDINAKDLLAM